jgi:hypothetical protein
LSTIEKTFVKFMQELKDMAFERKRKEILKAEEKFSQLNITKDSKVRNSGDIEALIWLETLGPIFELEGKNILDENLKVFPFCNI